MPECAVFSSTPIQTFCSQISLAVLQLLKGKNILIRVMPGYKAWLPTERFNLPILPIFQPPNWVTATTFCGPLWKRYEHTGQQLVLWRIRTGAGSSIYALCSSWLTFLFLFDLLDLISGMIGSIILGSQFWITATSSSLTFTSTPS